MLRVAPSSSSPSSWCARNCTTAYGVYIPPAALGRRSYRCVPDCYAAFRRAVRARFISLKYSCWMCSLQLAHTRIYTQIPLHTPPNTTCLPACATPLTTTLYTPAELSHSCKHTTLHIICLHCKMELPVRDNRTSTTVVVAVVAVVSRVAAAATYRRRCPDYNSSKLAKLLC